MRYAALRERIEAASSVAVMYGELELDTLN